MKKIKIKFGFIIMLALLACSKEDSPAGLDSMANKAPGPFDLIGVTNGAAKVDVLPTFSWKPSVDPDGDSVTYDLLLDTQTEPATILASGIIGTTYTPTDRLHLTTPYNWNVVAKDGKGGSVKSATNIFTTRGLNFPTKPITPAALFSARVFQSTTVFDNKLWVIGGYDFTFKNDVWYSSDGANWSEVLASARFSPRCCHTTTVFDGKLWVIAGDDEFGDDGLKNDVWSSVDGITWIQVSKGAAFSAREGHTTVVYDNKLWVIGGYDGQNTPQTDVWYSEDGVTWSPATLASGISNRSYHTSAVFNNKLWVIGGNDGHSNNDVWYSSDGSNWIEAPAITSFPIRNSHTTVVYDNKLWVIGGRLDKSYKNDIWYSSDGSNWIEATKEAPFSPRNRHSSEVFNDKIWVIAGYDGRHKNDVWAMD